MKKIKSLCWLCWAGVALALVLVSIPAQAATSSPPDLMTYQGYLVDTTGTALATNAPKNYDVVFRIYNVPTGGTPLWAEQQTVTVDKGYFSALLGEGGIYSGEPRPALSTLFSAADASDRYIEILVKKLGTDQSDLTIAPRLRLLTSPYTFLASQARNAVNAQSAVNAQNLVNNSSAQVVTVTSANVGINKPAPTSALDVNGTVTATGLAVNGPASISGQNVLEFGIGRPGKGANSGKIGYQTFDLGLNITGAGADGHRIVSILAEDGTVTFGGLGVNKGSISSGYALDVNGAAKATSFSGYGTIPIGGIIMWSGAVADIPTGWTLCNGATVNTHVTPDLRNRFVVGAGTGSQYNVGDIGGTNTVTLSVNQIPAHSHTYTYRGGSDHGGGLQDDHWRYTATASTGSTGGGQAHENRPPYYALCYIMRVY